MQRIGLIAGNGRFPLIFARTARAQGVEVVAVAHEGETPEALTAAVDAVTWIKVGQLGRMIDAFKAAGIEQAVMAGGIHKAAQLEHFEPDERALACLSRLETFGDDAILRAIAAELERDGIRIVASTLYLDSLLTPPGLLTARQPTEAEWKDIRHGYAVAKALGQWDIGQTVVVKSGIVLAVEAIEGTDATIWRAGAHRAVVVKVSKPKQDLRFDVPAIGPETVRVCRGVEVTALALEAGKTLLLDRDEIVEEADAAGLCIVGV